MRRFSEPIIALSTMALTACVEPLSEGGRGCPCSGAWVCSDFDHICVPRDQACVAPVTSRLVSNDAGACESPTDPASLVPIDDFEDKNQEINGGGIDSAWFESDDKTGGCVRYEVAP